MTTPSGEHHRSQVILDAPSSDPNGLDQLGALWRELHGHHLQVAVWSALVADMALSWERRRALYRRILSGGGAYITARQAATGSVLGYAMVAVDDMADDTFRSEHGIAELITLIVSPHDRSAGTGASLLHSAERFAHQQGMDMLKVGVMAGNDRAQAFYVRHGYGLAEHILYRPIDAPPD